MADKNTKRPLFATRDFRDADTEKTFAKGDDVSGEAAAENYAAAGLASEDKKAAAADPAPIPTA